LVLSPLIQIYSVGHGQMKLNQEENKMNNEILIVQQMEQSNCPIKLDCPFYRKNSYNSDEIEFYQDYCLKGGVNCGMKKNHDLSERLRKSLVSLL